jgi:hypothetical protein
MKMLPRILKVIVQGTQMMKLRFAESLGKKLPVIILNRKYADMPMVKASHTTIARVPKIGRDVVPATRLLVHRKMVAEHFVMRTMQKKTLTPKRKVDESLRSSRVPPGIRSSYISLTGMLLL